MKFRRKKDKYDPTVRVNKDTKKTPFVKHFTDTGVTYSCIYSDKEQTALVAIFTDPRTFDTSRTVPIRIHSSCANSDILGGFDCDCRSQLLSSINVLRKQNGVLIHIFQEGRGSGIFAKYLGMYTMQSHCVSTYDAYKKLNLKSDVRKYPLAFKILRDLGINNIALLSNNPRKMKAVKDAGFSVVLAPLPGEITPQNFSYLFSKFIEGHHQIQTLFPEKGEYYFCKTPSVLGPFKRTWIFDADDTLWEDNIAYIKIINSFIEHCRPHLKEVTESEIRQLIDETEEKTIQETGFGPYGFLKSLETTYGVLAVKEDIPYPSVLFQSIVPTLRSQPEALVSNVIKILTELEKRGDGLVLYTQGPLDIQLEKIARSNLAEHFHALCVVRSKSVDSLKKLIGDLRFDSGKTIIVGNSLRSDVEPALDAGLKAVHFLNPNSWHVQNLSGLDKSKYVSINELDQILDIDV